MVSPVVEQSTLSLSRRIIVRVYCMVSPIVENRHYIHYLGEFVVRIASLAQKWKLYTILFTISENCQSMLHGEPNSGKYTLYISLSRRICNVYYMVTPVLENVNYIHFIGELLGRVAW